MRQTLRDLYLRVFSLVKKPKPGIHIMNAHYVTLGVLKGDEQSNFRKFVQYVANSCTLMRIEDAVDRISNRNIPTEGVYVAFTYDDGYEECHSVIAPVLEEFNCNAAFFINANYIESDLEYQSKFHEQVKIWTKSPLSWNQVRDLHNRGHIIGSHTLDHLWMSKLDINEKKRQLEGNKLILESRLDTHCDYFAWPYGQLIHFDEISLKLALEHHKFVFSGTDYRNYFSMNGRVINRRHIESFWPKEHVKYFLSVNKMK